MAYGTAYSLRGRVFAPQGFHKLVFDKGTGVILGVHIRLPLYKNIY
jgi:pyruvate/2-oxoglutarate dehydrogenase complex dihydrolipoamide dehydrogenase (E3) component